MPNSAGEPEPTKGPLESSGSEESDQVENRSLSKEEEPATQASASGEAAAEAQDWWSEQPASDWAQSAGSAPNTEPAIPKESRTADVYFCGHTTLLSLSRALQAIAKEKLTGALRAFWDRESIELLAQDGAIVFATTPPTCCGAGAALWATAILAALDGAAGVDYVREEHRTLN